MITLFEITQPPTNIPQQNLRVVAPVATAGIALPVAYYAGGLDFYNNKVVPTVNSAIDTTNKTINTVNEKINGTQLNSTIPNVSQVKDPLSFDKSKLGELTLRGAVKPVTDILDFGANMTNKYIANPLINKINNLTGSNINFLRTNNNSGPELMNMYGVAKPETMAEKAYVGTLSGLGDVATGAGMLKGVTSAGLKAPGFIKNMLGSGDSLRSKVTSYAISGGLGGGLSAYE